MIYASVGATGIGLLITAALWLKLVPQNAQYVQTLLNLVAGVTFLMFLKNLATFIGRRDLAGKAKSVLTWCIACAVLFSAAMVLVIGSVGAAALAGRSRAVWWTTGRWITPEPEPESAAC